MNQTWNRSRGDRLFDMLNVIFFIVLLVIMIYPIYFSLIASFSDPDAINSGAVLLIPKHVSLIGYQRILQDHRIWTGYRNSFLYMIVGTAIKVSLTITAGYVLSRKDLVGRQLFMMIIVFTMFFQGGIIPTYLLVKSLGMVNTMWAMVLPGAVVVFQLIIARTFFQTTIPVELFEAASMDGCGNWRFFFQIVLPLSLPIIAVVALYSAVSEWNAYFQALIYLRDADLQPLQMILRDILIQNQVQSAMTDPEGMADLMKAAEQIKYGIILVASLPMLVLYPFLQKYFVKGVMIGSIKG